MREIPLTFPEIGLINGTRFVIGTGLGLLLAEKMDRNTRKAVGISLLAAGILFSIPAGMSFLGKLRGVHSPGSQISDGKVA
jgi:hypothetical protein